jgi:hypothetical protein
MFSSIIQVSFILNDLRRYVLSLKIYKAKIILYFMAATPPGAKKRRLDYNVDQAVYDEFVKACSRKGFAPQVILEQAMKKFTQTGQI